MLSQKHFLLLVRVQPIFVCSIFHTTKITIILETAKENSKKKFSGNSSTEAKDLVDFLLILFKKTKPTGVIPKKSDEQAIAYDVFIPVTQRVRMGRVKIPLHIAISLPYNVEEK